MKRSSPDKMRFKFRLSIDCELQPERTMGAQFIKAIKRKGEIPGVGEDVNWAQTDRAESKPETLSCMDKPDDIGVD